MQYLVGSLLLLVSYGAFAVGTDNGKLVGTWTWTRAANHCTETLTFRDDGTLSTTSGEEKTDNQYTLTPPSLAGSRYMLTIHVIKDHGGKDCVDSTVDNTGSTDVVYIEFLSKTQMKMCYRSTDGNCFGPLHKIGE